MKKVVLCLLFVFLNTNSFADTCPSIENASPTNPPAGWSVLLQPAMDGQQYYFGAAIHSLSGAYYYGQVICKYEACPNAFCPAYALISNKTYALPNTKAAPWNARSILQFTFTCIPADHDPEHCVFR